MIGDYAALQGKGFTPMRIGSTATVTVLVPAPDLPPVRPFVGRADLVQKCQAAWLDVHGEDPLHFRLLGPPGVGKNELVYYLAREVEHKPLYIIQGHEELTPEDLACGARIRDDNRVEYVGSPLLGAMLAGGICFFDEIGKTPARALSVLASVLDGRRTLTSALAGFSVCAGPGFRFCAAGNDADAVSNGLPGFLDERLRPELRMTNPPLGELLEIIRTGTTGLSKVLLDAFVQWLRSSDPPEAGRVSPRQALSIVSLASRLARVKPMGEPTRVKARELIEEAAAAVCNK